MSFNSKFNNITHINPIEEFMCLNESNELKPFKKHWLNNAHLETLLPGSSWEKIYDLIIPELCDRLVTQFSHENRKQALFELLGKYFVSKHFPMDDPDPSITRPPIMSSEESIKLYDEAKKWLDITVERIVKETGIYERDTGVMSEDMSNYVDQARSIFMCHFKKELAKRESEYFKKISSVKPVFRPSDAELHHKPQTAISSVYDNDLPYTIQTISPYGPEMMIAPMPHCVSFQSEFIGESLASLCYNNEESVQKISSVMSGRRLPISLRKFMWKNILLHSQSPIYDKEINFEELMKEKFSRTVTRGMTELKISNETKSPVNELLENLIVEHYEKSLPLNKFCDDIEFLSEAVKILNILYAYDRSYDPHLVFWLFPLHFGMKDEADTLPMHKIPFSYDVAMYVSLMHNIYPSWSDIFNMAEQVLNRLTVAEPELADHIFMVAQKNVLSKPKEFLAQIMDIERNKAKMKRLSKIGIEDTANDIRGFDILKSPIIFVRKWIGEGFVSVLNSEAVLFVFDQLFMEKFSTFVFEDACLAIILLLKNRFLVTEDHENMKAVFLEYPSSIFTVDFIRAWVWIHRGGDLLSVPAMNRREIYKYVPPETVSIEPSAKLPIILPTIAFNDIRLKLVFTALNTAEKQFVADFNPNMLAVTVALYLVNSKLVEISTKSFPILKDSVDDINTMTKSYIFDLKEVIEFQNIDVTHLSDQFKEGDQLDIIVSVNYRNADTKTTTFGWCPISCLIEDDYDIPILTESQLLNPFELAATIPLKIYVDQMKVKRLRHEIPINLGDVPNDFHPKYDNSKLCPIMNGSLLGIYSFNGATDPPSPPSSAPPAKNEEPAVNAISLPSAPTPRASTPVKEESPRGLPKGAPVEPEKHDDSWVPFNPTAFEKIKPRFSSKSEPFCVYVDQIRFLPDTATIIKVTGRFFQSGYEEKLEEILMIPDVESDPRSPKFRPSSRVVVNKDRTMNLNSKTLLVLRVYTVLRTNLELQVVGNIIVPIFDQTEDILLSGCFQKRLRNQMPKLGTIDGSNLNKNSLDGAPYVECVSMTYRVWPFTENTVVASDYSSGVYESSDCKPTKFEWNIFGLYKSDTFLSKDLRDVVKVIKYRDANPELKDEAVTHIFMMNYIPYRLDAKEFLPPNQIPRHIATELMFHYRIEKGINITISNVFGLAEDKLLFVTTKVIRSEKTSTVEPRPSLGYGVDEFNVFSYLDPASPMKAPKFKDAFQMIRPYLDDKALLVVQVWGINAKVNDGVFCDKITNKPIIKLTKENLVAWTAIQLFNYGFVNTGKHQLPLFTNRIHHALLKRFQQLTIPEVIKNEEEFKTSGPSSIMMYIFDAHKQIDEYPVNQPILTNLLEVAPVGKEAFVKAMETDTAGKKIIAEINETIPDVEMTGQTIETKSTLFRKYFNELAKKLSISVPAKQPYLPIFF